MTLILKEPEMSISMNQILVPVDFSKNTAVAIEKALEIKKLTDANIFFVHFVEPLPATLYGAALVDVDKELMSVAKEQMSEVCQKFNINEADTIIKQGHAKLDIIKIAKEKEIDLIIIGSHGHSILGDFLGSTSSRIASHAPCDVMIVRSPTRE